MGGCACSVQHNWAPLLTLACSLALAQSWHTATHLLGYLAGLGKGHPREDRPISVSSCPQGLGERGGRGKRRAERQRRNSREVESGVQGRGSVDP